MLLDDCLMICQLDYLKLYLKFGGYAIGLLHKALAHAEAKIGKESLEFYRST